MIIHKLLEHYFRGDVSRFYLLQAQDSIRWLQASGVRIAPGMTVLDLGCGHGIFGAQFQKTQCDVVYADITQYLDKDVESPRFISVDLDRDDFEKVGKYDLVICSNVFEHLQNPDRFLRECTKLLKPKGYFYLTWTNWLSPFGGHEFAPLHYLGVQRGQRIYDRLVKKPRNHTVYENLFPTYIGKVLRQIRNEGHFEILKVAPRYYTEFGFIMKLPALREFLAWNCATLMTLRRNTNGAPPTSSAILMA